ncbi:MAG: efflux RND transporter permease subunit [Planctomycetota bacterium]
MSGFAGFAIDHSRFTWLLIFATVVGGLGVFASQPRQEDPEVVIRSAQVVVQAPGLSPERIEQLVTKPIEYELKEISEIDEIKSLSMTGLSIVTPQVADRYTDMDPIWADVRNKMDDLAPSLPEGAFGPTVNDDYGQVAVITLALTGEAFSMADLHAAARDVRDELSKLPLVGRVDLYGVQEERIWIEFDAAFLLQFGLDPQQIATTLRQQNIVLPGGTVDADGQNITVEPSGDFASVQDIRQVAIETQDGQLVYLEDLATVRRGYEEPANAPAFYDGKPAIVLGLSMVEKSNVVELGRQVRGALTPIRRSLPLGMDLDVAIFQPDLVQASVKSATVNLLQTVAVVLFVVMLALGLRTGLIVGAMVPLTMMLTLIGMSIVGIELHRISIAAIIVALGLLVDNGVVIAEDIKKRIDEGMDRLDAVYATPKTLAVPLLTSSLTTVAAFMPLVLIQGGSGEFLRALGQVLTIALLTSWLIAISIVPAFCYWFLPKQPPKATTQVATGDDPYTAWPYRLYRSVLTRLLRFRLPFVAVMVLLLLSSMFVFQFIKQRSLGPSERNQFTVYVDLPAGSTVDDTTAATDRLTAFLQDESTNPEVAGVLAYVGAGGPRFFLSLSPNDPQPNKAFLVVNTEQPEDIDAVMPRVDRFLVEAMPEAVGRSDLLFLGNEPLGTVKFEVAGPDIDVIRRVGNQVAAAFHTIPGAQSIRNDWENPVLKLRVEIDQERARRAGVTSTDIATALSATFDGVAVTDYREGELIIPVSFRANAEDRSDLDRVRSVEVMSSSRGVPVPLIQVADFRGVVEPSKIKRVDQRRVLTVAAKHPEMTSGELFAAMQPALGAIDLPRGYTLEVAGEIRDSAESNRNLFRFAPHAVFVIVLLLVLQFNSFRRPAAILLTIPLVLIGANYGLLLFDGFFDFTAMLGLFSLAGIIVNNGIVLIERVDEARGEGHPVNDAVVVACLARARPIIMTTVTTVVGLVPLALFGGEFWYGMAIVIMCGLGVGSVLTLGFVPVVYSLMFRGGRHTKTSPAPPAPATPPPATS